MDSTDAADVIRYANSIAGATLCLLIIAFYTHPRNRPNLHWQWLVIWSWALFVISNLYTDLVRLGEPPDPRILLRTLANLTGLAAIGLAYRHKRKHADDWAGTHGAPE